MVCSQVTEKVGQRLGRIVEVERRRGHIVQNLRVKVAIPLEKPLRRGGYLLDSGGQRVWVKFRYERLPMHCHFCGMFGHDLKHCASYSACTKTGEVVCQYDEWLKASGGHPQSPRKREPKLKRAAMEERSGKNSVDAEVGVVAVAVAVEQEKQAITLTRDTRKGELRVQSYSVNAGPVSRLDDVGAENEGDMGLDMEIEDSVLAINISLVLNLNKDDVARPKSLEEGIGLVKELKRVEGQALVRLPKSKNKPTWKRLARIVCVMSDSDQKQVTVLGKRDTDQKEDDKGKDHAKQRQKKEKIEVQQSQNTIATGVSNRPYRSQ